VPDSRLTPVAAVDVRYPPAGGARAAAVLAATPSFADVLAERVTTVTDVAPYQPGAFSHRDRPGLGARLHAEFAIPVIGVAKSPFRTATHAIPVLRGESSRPLLVTAVGMPRDDAADLVRQMAGRFRVPDALRRADALARGSVPRYGQ
jgi:deoxyribonuclease V